MNLEYGQWCTIEGKRYMIVDWSENYITVHTDRGRLAYHKSEVSNISDYINR